MRFIGFRAMCMVSGALIWSGAMAQAQSSDEPAAPAEENPAAPAGENAEAEAPAAPTVTKTENGDWTVLCEVEAGRCIMRQVGQTAAGETALSMEVERLPEPQTVNGQTVEAVARILTPLGVVLPQGLRLQIDGGQTQTSPYFLCAQSGCLVRAPMQPSLVSSLKRGARARLAFTFLQNGQPQDVVVDLSLAGFTASYDSL